MGSTEQLLPFPNINCDAVRTLLLRNRSSESTPRLECLLGIGLARVLAHEIYHELLNTPNHGRSGVAKASFAASDLFAGVLRFQSGEIEKINQAVSAREIAAVPSR